MRRAKGDLDRSKRSIEDRAAPTGAWRGVVQGGETTQGASVTADATPDQSRR